MQSCPYLAFYKARIYTWNYTNETLEVHDESGKSEDCQQNNHSTEQPPDRHTDRYRATN